MNRNLVRMPSRQLYDQATTLRNLEQSIHTMQDLHAEQLRSFAENLLSLAQLDQQVKVKVLATTDGLVVRFDFT